MAQLPITLERLHQLLDYNKDTGVFKWRVWRGGRAVAGSVAGQFDGKGHRQITVDSAVYSAHRLAWFYVTGNWPVDQIDHVNGVRADNRIANLREATPAQNNQNIRRPRKDSSLGLLGVTRSTRNKPRPFVAQISVDRKRMNLGYFATAEEAHAAYVAAKRKLHAFGTL